MKVFITRVIAPTGLQLLRDAGHQVTEWKEKRELTAEELVQYCKEHDALLSVGPNKINAEFVKECSHLKVIALHAVGFDNVDVPAATKARIPVSNTPGVLSDATADTAFLLLLAVSRKAFYLHKTIEKGEWGFFDPLANLGFELMGKTLGIVGLGKIGLEMAKRCVGAYEMKVLYHNRHRNEAAEKEVDATWVSFDELLSESDVVSVHTALTPETRGMFNSAAFHKMKPASVFINAARGSIHNEEDLSRALQDGIIWGAGLDVTNPEPMRPGNALLNMSNVAILPHIGSATIEARSAMACVAATNVVEGLNGRHLPNIINPDVYK
jgi:glyoxylate reductase